MKKLLLLRHVKSSWKKKSLLDHDRPLNKRGKSDVPRMGRLLRHEQLVPDLIVASTAKRTRETALGVARGSGYVGDLYLTPVFYESNLRSYAQLLKRLSNVVTSILLVGHNPVHEEFLTAVTGIEEQLPTSALAHLTLSIAHWQAFDADTRGQLIEVWRPRKLSLCE